MSDNVTLTRNGKRLSTAFSKFIQETLQDGKLDLASRATVIRNTLEADPASMNKLAKIIQREG